MVVFSYFIHNPVYSYQIILVTMQYNPLEQTVGLLRS